MKRLVVLYGVGLALAALALQWLDLQFTVRSLSAEVYVVILAVAFTALGLWAGARLTRNSPAEEFRRNDRALKTLKISEREYQVLEQLAEGLSNKEIAARLFVSPNTVKTHAARLYAKLEVSRRTQAVRKARELRLIP